MKRWIEDGGSATPFERDLLRSALSMEPPPDAQRQVWAAVLTQIPTLPGGAGGGGGGSGGGPSAGHGATAAGKAAAGKSAAAVKGAVAMKGAAGAGILKSALIGAGSAVALLTTYSVVAPSAPAPDPLASDPPAAQASPATLGARPRRPSSGVRPVVQPDTPQAEPEPAATPAPSAVVGGLAGGPNGGPGAGGDRRSRPEGPEGRAGTPAGAAGPGAAAGAAGVAAPVPEAERETMLREESRQVSEARDALRRGDASGALGQLEQVRTRFPGGVLVQEREALAIEALARSGRRTEASARATAFLQAYPTSVHAERVQAFIQSDAAQVGQVGKAGQRPPSGIQ